MSTRELTDRLVGLLALAVNQHNGNKPIEQIIDLLGLRAEVEQRLQDQAVCGLCGTELFRPVRSYPHVKIYHCACGATLAVTVEPAQVA